MSDNFSPRDFLRRAPNTLLSRYFNERNLLTEINIAELPETKIEAVWEAIQALTNEQKDTIEADFRKVASLSTKRAIQILFEAITEQGLDCPEFEKKRGYTDKALWVFLEYPTIFEEAYHLIRPYAARRNWKTFHYYTPDAIALEEQKLINLRDAISHYFRQKQGRGKFCTIERHTYLGKECLFVYPSNYPQEIIHYKDTEFERSTHHLAFEVVFVFSNDSDALDIWLAEPLGTVRDVANLWAEHILGSKIDFDAQKPSFSLEPFSSATHNLEIPADSPIMRIAIHKLRFVPALRPKNVITVEADTNTDANAVYTQINEAGLEVRYIKQVGLDVYIQNEKGIGETKRRFDISPRSSGLGHDGNDAIIRQFLKASGIEADA